MTEPTDRSAHFQRGLDAYRAGQHYEAHEFWEELWQDEEDEDMRRFLQALIQIASAVHKIVNDTAPRGSLKLLDRALERTEGLPDIYGGIALGALRQGVARFRAEVARVLEPEGRGPGLDRSAIPAIEAAGRHRSKARRPEPERVAQAERPAWFARGLEAYRSGEHFEAHELWEDLWRDEEDPFQRNFYQGLIQVAAAMHKLLVMKGTPGAIHLLERAHFRLRDVPDGTLGLDMPRLLDDLVRARTQIEALAREGSTALDPAFIPRIDLRASAG